MDPVVGILLVLEPTFERSCFCCMINVAFALLAFCLMLDVRFQHNCSLTMLPVPLQGAAWGSLPSQKIPCMQTLETMWLWRLWLTDSRTLLYSGTLTMGRRSYMLLQWVRPCSDWTHLTGAERGSTQPTATWHWDNWRCRTAGNIS